MPKKSQINEYIDSFSLLLGVLVNLWEVLRPFQVLTLASILHLWGEVWLQDLRIVHLDVVRFCMLFAHVHYSFVFTFFVWLPLRIVFSNFLDISKLQVYV